MFQNIIDEEIKEEKNYDTDKKKRVINLKGLFSVSDFVLYAISFMVSMDSNSCFHSILLNKIQPHLVKGAAAVNLMETP